MIDLQGLRSICSVVLCCAVILIAGIVIGASKCSANAQPAPMLTKPTTPPSIARSIFYLGDADRPLPFRSADGREWCPTPVTSLAWTVCQ